jgi:hypothetical protein
VCFPCYSHSVVVIDSCVVYLLQVVTASDSNMYDDTMKHGQHLSAVDFYDNSEVGIIGAVQLSQDQRTPEPFQGCGVGGIRVTAYLQSDTARATPIGQTPLTTNTGAFTFSVPLYSKLVLVPSYIGEGAPSQNPIGQQSCHRSAACLLCQILTLTLVPSMLLCHRVCSCSVHTFEPAFMLVTVHQSTIQLQPFLDVTTARFSAVANGGACLMHIGMFKPVVELTSCKAQPIFTLGEFGSHSTYFTLPAMEYNFRLYHHLDSGSGLQPSDLGGYVLSAEYANGPVREWSDKYEPQVVDLRAVTASTEPVLTFNYIAPATITPLRPATCVDELVLDTANSKYLYLYAQQLAVVKFDLYETYGYIDTDGNKHQFKCGHVTTGVEVLDSITQPGQPLLSYYTGPDYGCKDTYSACAMPAVYNGNFSTTTATYILQAGDIERSENQNSEGNHFAPSYSRSLQYRLAGSVLDWQQLHVVLLGTYSFPGTVTLLTPPFDALFILRDPPGGSSTASLKQGTTLETESSIHNAVTSSYDSSFKLTAGTSVKTSTCEGLGAESCQETVDTKAEASLSLALSADGSAKFSSTSSSSVSMSQTVTTSSNPSYRNGDGDLFLTESGVIHFASAVTIDGSLIDDPNHAGQKICKTTLRPTVSWTKGTSNTFVWSSTFDILTVIIPSFEKANAALMAQYEVSDIFALQAASADAYSKYRENLNSIAGWQGLLAQNDLLKANSLPWPDFYSSMSGSGAVAQMLSTATQAAASGTGDITAGSDAGTTASLAANALANAASGFQMKSSAYSNVGSITFFGGSELEFELEAESTQESEREIEIGMEATATLTSSFSGEFFGVEVGLESEKSIKLGFSHGQSGMSSTKQVRTITIKFADEDEGDMFEVEIRKDAVYGSPVYRVLGGQSRCPWEDGTVSRDGQQMAFAQSTFLHVNPYSAISTTLDLTNLSPTQESFKYDVGQIGESNPHGLKFFIDGLGFNQANLLVSYGQTLQMTVDIQRGGNGYTFEMVQFQMDPNLALESPKGEPICVRVSTAINVYYDEPCSHVDFAGALASAASFTVNQASLDATADGLPVLPIVIRNPESTLQGRRWLNKADANGFLQSVSVQYRAAPAGQLLSELDWAPVITVGSNGIPIDVLATIRQKYAQTGIDEADYFTMLWDMNSLTDGDYQLRAITQCKVPLGARDTSLYTYTTAPITGSLAIEPPRLFGTPLPSVLDYLPGDPISVTFDQPIVCASQLGRARVFAWVNPGTLEADRSKGIPIATQFVCKDSTVSVQFSYALWTSLVDRLVTVQVDRVRDAAGNVQADLTKWSFTVAQFAHADSPVLVSNLLLTGVSLSRLEDAYGGLANLQLEISQEVADLVNLAIDTIAHPHPAAATSADGLQREGVVTSMLQAAPGGGIKFRLQFIALPTFPGQPAAKYTASDFAYYLGLALQPVNLTAAALGLPQQELAASGTFSSLAEAQTQVRLTAELRTLYADNITFPLLSSLAPQSTQPVSMQVKVVPTSDMQAGWSAYSNQRPASHSQMAKKAQSRVARAAGMSRIGATTSASQTPSTVHDMTLTSTYDRNSGSALVVIQWQADSSSAVVLDVNNLHFSYVITALETDANVASTTTLPTASVTIDLTDPQVASFSQNVQPGASPSAKALYRIVLFTFPTSPGGSTVDFTMAVRNSTAATLHTSEYSWTLSSFIVSAPSTPFVRSVQQSGVDSIDIRVNPVWNNGLAIAAGDQGVTYSVVLLTSSTSITPASGVTLATSAVVESRLPNALAAPVVRLQASLAGLSQLGFALPTNGASATWTFAIIASTVVGSSQSSTSSVVLSSPSAALLVTAVQQTALNAFLITFSSPVVPSTPVLLTYNYQLVAQNAVQSTVTLNPMTDITASSTQLSFSATVTLTESARLARMSAFAAAVQSQGSFGLSLFSWFNISSSDLLYVSPPLYLEVEVQKNTRTLATDGSVTQQVLLTWAPPAFAVPAFDVLTSYVVSVTISDGMQFHYVPFDPVVLLTDTPSSSPALNLTLPLLQAPVSGVPLLYSFEVQAQLYGKVDSQPATVQLRLSGQQFLDSHVFASDSSDQKLQAGTPLALQGQTVSDVAQASHLALTRITTDYTQMTASADAAASAPTAVTDFDLWQVSPTTLLLSFTVPSSPTIPANAFVLAWREAVSTSQLVGPSYLGSTTIDANRAVNGKLVAEVSSLTFDRVIVGEDPMPYNFFFSLASISSSGTSSASVSKYGAVTSSSGRSDATMPRWLPSVGIADLFFDLLIAVTLLGLLTFRLVQRRWPWDSDRKSVTPFGSQEAPVKRAPSSSTKAAPDFDSPRPAFFEATQVQPMARAGAFGTHQPRGSEGDMSGQPQLPREPTPETHVKIQRHED